MRNFLSQPNANCSIIHKYRRLSFYVATMNLFRVATHLCIKNLKCSIKTICTTSQKATVLIPSQNGSRNHLEHLTNRSLINLKGPDSSGLLQGLITNDIHQIPQDKGKFSSLYAMFLNSKGRIICDSIIYAVGENDSFIVEADSLIVDQLIKHLKMYKLRKKVDIQLMDSYKVFVLYNTNESIFNKDKALVPEILECKKQDSMDSTSNGIAFKDLFMFCDPRVVSLGYRILTNKLEATPDEFKVGTFNPPKSGVNYRWLRYNLGVGEGVTDIPPQVCSPLEHNCDYMNGLHVQKGCYLGQELTARTYHTGKIRKRLMPVFLKKTLEQTPNEVSLQDEQNNSLGKLRGVQYNVALALLRMHLVTNIEFNVGDAKAVTKIPYWWPGFKAAKTQDEIVEKKNQQVLNSSFLSRNV